jgi:UDP-3-O-[3-hydroxymyristoyl] glucosamine N-acyltransferase
MKMKSPGTDGAIVSKKMERINENSEVGPAVVLKCGTMVRQDAEIGNNDK